MATPMNPTAGKEASEFRPEHDTMGEVPVPREALWGAATQRAVENFPVSGERVDPALIHAYGLVKAVAARVNAELGALPESLAGPIEAAAREVAEGRLDDHFVVDVFQTGSGTSTNMNLNEVIANRASQLSGGEIGPGRLAHANDHVNLSQSSNDTFPTAMHLAIAGRLRGELRPALEALAGALEERSRVFHEILKVGRTHLMDATPVRLGDEFGGYARQVALAASRVEKAVKALRELPLGGTAVGTGLNCPPGFAEQVVERLAEATGIGFVRAANAFESQAARDAVVEASGQLKTVAASLFKIANDIRWLASGPRCGIGEIALPPTQPGSSIMPGKVNPVIAESLMQVCAQVVGNDAAVTWGGANGNFELNTMMPMMAQNVLRSARLLARGAEVFRSRCVEGIEARPERCESLVEWSMSMVTALAPRIGYEAAAEIAKESVETSRTVREICEERKILPPEELARLLDPGSMV